MKYFRWLSLGRALLDGPSEIEEPISAEIFSVERLEQYAETLARTQEVSPLRTAGISLMLASGRMEPLSTMPFTR